MLPGDGLRAFLARVVGWSDERALELAERSLSLAADHRATLVLCGEGDMVPIAKAVHRRVLGPDKPFIVCDPRRVARTASVRSPASRDSGVAAFEAAIGGSLCVRTRRLPPDFPALVARLRAADDVLCVVCASQLAGTHPSFILPAPLTVPPLTERAAELNRIIAEYADDAVVELAAPAGSFTASDHAWVREHAATSLAEIEVATLRLVALRTSRNVSHAASRLGMTMVSLSRWIGRRKLPPSPAPRQAECPQHGRIEGRAASPTLVGIWEGRVLDMLEESQREGNIPRFEFGDANVRDGAEEWLARVKGGPASPESREAIAGLEALLADLEARSSHADPDRTSRRDADAADDPGVGRLR